MSNKDQEGFYHGTRRYVALLLAAAPLFAFSKFVQGNLGLNWRRWLTQHLCGLYFGNRAFYALKIGYLSAAGKESGVADGSGKCKGEEQGGGIDNPVSAVSGILSFFGNHSRTFHVGNYTLCDAHQNTWGRALYSLFERKCCPSVDDSFPCLTLV